MNRPRIDDGHPSGAPTEPGCRPPFQAIAEGLPAPLYTVDAAGLINFYNEAAAVLWGHRPALGEDSWRGGWQLFRADGSPLADADSPIGVTLETGRAAPPAQLIAERPDGSRYAFRSQPTPLFDAEGGLAGAMDMIVPAIPWQDAEAFQRLAAIVESSDDAIIGKTLDGRITNWNAGAERIFGWSADEIMGQSILTLIPENRHFEEVEIIQRLRRGERIEHYETIRRHKHGHEIYVSLTVSPIRGEDGTVIGASKIARDVSNRRRVEQLRQQQTYRLETLNRVARVISRDLDLDRIVQAVTDIATDLSGAKFGAFFYNIIDERGEAFLLYALSGATRDAFETLGMPRNTAIFAPTFDGTGIVRSNDIRKDPRYGHNAPLAGMPEGHLPVVSYLAVPVVSSSGDVLGGLFFGHDEPAMFDEEVETLISAVAAQAAVAIDNARLHKATRTEVEQRRKAESAQELLLNEIKHRVKNTLATVQAMAAQSFRRSPPEESDAFVSRLHALSAAHDLLTQQNWESVMLAELAEEALRPFREKNAERVSISGPDVRLDPNKALLLTMVLHELATNAVKYGALSGPCGKVGIDWNVAGSRLTLRWRESGGPPVSPPAHKGFGSRMIERALKGERGAAHFDFAPGGVGCTVELTI